MQFGLFVPQGWRHDLIGIEPAEQWKVMRSLAQHADQADWDSIWVFDHFHTVPVASEQATHEAWTLTAAFAASTSRVRIGTMCTCVSYRNPVLLAKMAATVDIVSGGRLEMGIGAGAQPGPSAGTSGAEPSPSFQHEWHAYGYGSPSTRIRLERLREGVEIVRQAWATGTATLNGKHFEVDGAIVRPLPLQQGGPPLWIAGGGEKVTLRIAAEYARYTNFAGTPQEFDRKSEILRQHCADAGRDFGAITRSSNFDTVIGSTEAEVSDRLDAIRARVLPYLGERRADAFMRKYDRVLGVGTPEQIAERLTDLQARGMTYGIFYFPEAAYERSGMELFEREVIPALA